MVLARSGAGKSYFAKLEALRSLYRGVEVAVIDPEDEYRRLAGAVGGAYLHLGAPGVRLNPFDLAPGPEPVTSRGLFVHSLVAVLLGGRRAFAEGRPRPGSHRRLRGPWDNRRPPHPPPAITSASRPVAALQAQESDGRELAARLAPFVAGTHRRLFDGPTTTRAEGHLVCFSLRDLPEELKAAGTLLTLDAVWRRVAGPGRPRRHLVVVDEAWLLMRDPEGARFLFRMAKSARKHWCGLSVVTQDAADLLSSDLGKAVVANAATQVLLRQAPQGIDTVGEAFRLSEGERAYLLGARRGDALLAAGADRVAFSVVASPAEDALATSDPAALTNEEPDL